MEKEIKRLLEGLYNREIDPELAFERLKGFPFKQIYSDIKLDTHRPLRTGLEEAVLGLGKSKDQLKRIIDFFDKEGQKVLVTKVDKEKGEFLKKEFSKGEFFEEAGLFVLNKKINLSTWEEKGDVVVVCAGSSDLKVGLEALGTLLFYDVSCGMICDVGVAGLHRLFPYLENLRSSKVIIVVAGMEGALPSVVSSLVDKPIIGVPTSVGYGACLSGIAPLLGMLNSCAPGIGVVNIDNGFGAATFAIKILNQIS